MFVPGTSNCTVQLENKVLQAGEITATYQESGHQWKVLNYVNKKFNLMDVTTHNGNYAKVYSEKTGHIYPFVSHDVEACTFNKGHGSSLFSRCRVDVSNRSKWIAAATVIVALFAVAMYARFGGGFGLSTVGTNAFVGATSGALGLYTLLAASAYRRHVVHQKANAEI